MPYTHYTISPKFLMRLIRRINGQCDTAKRNKARIQYSAEVYMEMLKLLFSWFLNTFSAFMIIL